ncbi:hypothetical protein Goari_025024 [Gossypium aridum]|uniref:Uncharacterized protein n=1 Tax=Gossypium aridum TaxID=34290 RepID=A0A7J8X8D8_GOSAI|nr:hypothetical protein [Gossypium aridum]
MVMKLRILFMYFGIVSQLRKFGRRLSQVIISVGAVARENGSASAGGVVRDHKGFERATIQTDNIDVVKALKDNKMANL